MRPGGEFWGVVADAPSIWGAGMASYRNANRVVGPAVNPARRLAVAFGCAASLLVVGSIADGDIRGWSGTMAPTVIPQPLTTGQKMPHSRRLSVGPGEEVMRDVVFCSPGPSSACSTGTTPAVGCCWLIAMSKIFANHGKVPCLVGGGGCASSRISKYFS